MPKYIRTKDTIFEVLEDYKNSWLVRAKRNNKKTYSKGKKNSFFVKQADTIEELCDGFWWENKMYDEPIFIPNYQLVLDRFNAWRQSDKTLNSNCLANITIYGSIYIKGKGWFHVAKLNESVVLELL